MDGGAMGGSAIRDSTDGAMEVGAYLPPATGIVADMVNGSTVLVKVAEAAKAWSPTYSEASDCGDSDASPALRAS